MAILNQKRILNLIPKTSAPVTIHVSQGDVGTEIEFTLVKGDELFVNTGSLSASVHGIREDGANFGVFTCTLSGSSVKFPLHAEMTAVKGSAIAEIVLVDSQGNKVGSSNFGIMVEESVFPLGVTYDNDMSVYESILAYVQSIPAQVEADITAAVAQEAATRAAADEAFNTALATTNSDLSNEIGERTSADEIINTRIDEIIAPSGEAPNPAEITDARIGADGTTYPILGGAIRKQIEKTYQTIKGFGDSTTLSNLNDIKTNTIIRFVPTSSYRPTNLPSEMANSIYVTLRATNLTNAAGVTAPGCMQELIDMNGGYYVRYLTNIQNDTWTRWYKLNSEFDGGYAISRTLQIISDLNDVLENKILTFISQSGANPLHMPPVFKNSQYFTLRVTTLKNANGVVIPGTMQELFDSTGNIWTRYLISGSPITFSEWKQITDGYNIVPSIQTLSDLNTVNENSVITFVPTSSNIPENFPKGATLSQYYTLTTTIITDGTYIQGGTKQVLTNGVGQEFYRYKTNSTTWGKWQTKQKVFTVGSSDANFTSFSEAVIALRNYENSTLLVNEGTYDLLAELDAIYPGYFTNYNSDDPNTYPDNRGLAIGWGMKIIFSPKAKITCNYQNDDAVTQSFSPLYAFNSDFELIGCNIECSMVRYAIHDDPAPDSLKLPRYRHVYKDCHIYIDNSNSSRVFKNCIGGGFGKQSLIEIENCIFESVGVANDKRIVNYHNTDIENAQSRLVIKDCYFKTGTCGASYYGTTTLLSDVLITNNSVKALPYVSAETASSTVQNIDFMSYNNDVRN